MSRKASEWAKRSQISCMIGFYVFPYSEVSLKPTLKSILNKPTFVPMNEIQEYLYLDSGKYVVMCSTFENKQLGTFCVDVQGNQGMFEFTKLDL